MSNSRKDGQGAYVIAFDAVKVVKDLDARGTYWSVSPLVPWVADRFDTDDVDLLIGNEDGWRRAPMVACFATRTDAYDFVAALEAWLARFGE